MFCDLAMSLPLIHCVGGEVLVIMSAKLGHLLAATLPQYELMNKLTAILYYSKQRRAKTLKVLFTMYSNMNEINHQLEINKCTLSLVFQADWTCCRKYFTVWFKITVNQTGIQPINWSSTVEARSGPRTALSAPDVLRVRGRCKIMPFNQWPPNLKAMKKVFHAVTLKWSDVQLLQANNTEDKLG